MLRRSQAADEEKAGRLREPPGLSDNAVWLRRPYDSTRTFVACGLLFLPVPVSNETA
jgi:hypothetical protein